MLKPAIKYGFMSLLAFFKIIFLVSLSLRNAFHFSNFSMFCQGTKAPTAVGKSLCPLVEPPQNKIRDVWQGRLHKPPLGPEFSGDGL